MRKGLLTAVLLSASVQGAFSQVYFGAEMTPDSFLRSDEVKIEANGEDAFVWALSTEISTATLYSVFESTQPEKEMTGWLKKGIYRQELIMLLLMSKELAVPFKKLASELSSEGSMEKLSAKRKTDLKKLFSESKKLKASADAVSPLFIIESSGTVNGADISTASVSGQKDVAK